MNAPMNAPTNADSFAIVAHPRPEAQKVAHDTAEWLRNQGHEVWLADGDDRPARLDLAVSIGGDGTMLRTVDLVAAERVPILGVNVGHLGYLTRVEPADLEDALTRFLAGDYRVEVRMTLEVEVSGRKGEANERCLALNDAVLQRCSVGHTVHVRLSTASGPFITYAADTLIVATPTGSTAYNLSARGPILAPELRALVFTPVAPHLLFDRSLVLDAADTLQLTVLDGRPAELVVDGQSRGVLEEGTTVTCRAGAHDARLVSFAESHFLGILKAKFGLPDR
jgi:NAD+ kinase